MYINKGYAEGTLARDPQKVAEGVVLLTVRIRDNRINPVTKRREFHYPTFVLFGKESDKALQHLERGQEVSIEYKLETRRKEVNNEVRYFEDKVVTNIQYGRKPVKIEPSKTESAEAE